MFHKIGSFFGKLFGSAPSWTQKASAAITYVGPLVTGILALTTDPEYSGEVSNIIGEVKSDLALSSALVASAHGSGTVPAGLESALQSVNNNLDGLLAAGHIKNADTLNKVKAIVGLVEGETTAILQSLPKPSSSASAPTALVLVLLCAIAALSAPQPANAGVFRHVVKPVSKKAFHGAKKAVKTSAHVSKKVIY